ncbi:MAG: 23S rRNA (guanosine(2251)-2'-O)-methyltransferase RlmB [Alphaproteobacteria bacterium]|nr:23S rRNA (guanosine(2251)-2'-O)-methyltransferase RlmB [Alphaproteobacteria bacterium]
MRDNRRDNDRKGPRKGGKRPFGDKKPWGGKPGGGKPGGGKPWEKRGERDGDKSRGREERPFRDKKPWDGKPRGDKPWKKREDRGDRDDRSGQRDFKKRDFKKRDFEKRDGEQRDFGKRDFGKRDFEKKPFRKKFEKRDFDQKRPGRPRFERPRPERTEDEAPRGPRPNLFGFHAVREAWLNPERTIEALYLTDAGAAEFAAVQEEAAQKGIKRPAPVSIEKDRLERMLQRNSVHQGIAAVAAPLEEVFLQDLVIRASGRSKAILLMLDQVTDPHNVGAILRSACAFGAAGVIMQRMHAPALEGVLAKTATGAIEHLPVAYETNLSRSIEELKEAGFFVVGLDEHGDKTVADISGDKIVLVLGAEGAGLRRLVKENCDQLVKLPTKGVIQSLNVSNAAAVALYALT